MVGSECRGFVGLVLISSSRSVDFWICILVNASSTFAFTFSFIIVIIMPIPYPPHLQPFAMPPSLQRLQSFKDDFPARHAAYAFDGLGGFTTKPWDLTHNSSVAAAADGDDSDHGNSHNNNDSDAASSQFSWYHIELPRSDCGRLSISAQHLISLLCPPLKLRDILALASNGPFCGYVGGALIFRVNPVGSSTSAYIQRLAVRVTDRSVISVSLGRIPRLGFALPRPHGSLLGDVPRVHGSPPPSSLALPDSVILQEHVLEFLLTMNHSEEIDSNIPAHISGLVLHIIDTHIDYLQEIITKLEMDLDDAEHELDDGGIVLKQQMLENRLFPKMGLDLQRLLQVIAQGEQVFPRVREKCSGKKWVVADDLLELDILVGRLEKLKENVGFLSTRITALQTGLDGWQSEQINRKLYYLSLSSIIFLPLSVITSVFGMNVGGVPWTNQKEPSLQYGFHNVLLICAAILLLLLTCFCAAPVFRYLTTWQLRQSIKKKWMSIKGRGSQRIRPQSGRYTRL